MSVMKLEKYAVEARDLIKVYKTGELEVQALQGTKRRSS